MTTEDLVLTGLAVVGSVALGFGYCLRLFFLISRVRIDGKKDDGPDDALLYHRRKQIETMTQISGHIARGADAFLKTQYRYLIPFIAAASLVIAEVVSSRAAAANLVGCATSILAGYVGMKSRRRPPVDRTTHECWRRGQAGPSGRGSEEAYDVGEGYKVAMRGGWVASLSLTSFGVSSLFALAAAFHFCEEAGRVKGWEGSGQHGFPPVAPPRPSAHPPRSRPQPAGPPAMAAGQGRAGSPLCAWAARGGGIAACDAASEASTAPESVRRSCASLASSRSASAPGSPCPVPAPDAAERRPSPRCPSERAAEAGAALGVRSSELLARRRQMQLQLLRRGSQHLMPELRVDTSCLGGSKALRGSGDGRRGCLPFVRHVASGIWQMFVQRGVQGLWRLVEEEEEQDDW
ncbi:unnamed protein product [Prorocentrum cordatum]|uniref:H(+)-exporting diphosphatase n=1 Tax=Prorocentrum cordatum TaxID=2364126 RepID=A0ABN9XLJ1_9DINO|nr:unnamed protein product [Polarella glacialis]